MPRRKTEHAKFHTDIWVKYGVSQLQLIILITIVGSLLSSCYFRKSTAVKAAAKDEC